MNRALLASALVFAAGLLLPVAGYGQPYVMDSIDVGGAWVGSMCYNSRADVVYGRSFSANLFFTIDCATNQVISQFHVEGPWYGLYDSLDNKAYWTSRSGDIESVMVVDGTTHQRLRAIPVEWAAIPLWDPVADRLWVSCTEANEVVCIDCRTDSVIAHVPVGAGPLKMHLNTRRRKLYVQNSDDNSVSVLDLLGGGVRATLPAGRLMESGFYSPEQDKYYCDGTDRVSVVDGVRDSVLRYIPLPWRDNVYAMAGCAVPGLVLFAIFDTNAVWAVDARTDSVVQRVSVGRMPRVMYWSPATNLVYVGNGYTDDVSVLTGDGARLIATLAIGDAPFAFAYSTFHHRLYVGHLNSSMVYVIQDSAVGVREGVGNLTRHDTGLTVRPSVFSRGVAIESDDVGVASLVVYSLNGSLIRALQPQRISKRRYRALWDGRDQRGQETAAGAYVIVTEGGGQTRTRVVKLR